MEGGMLDNEHLDFETYTYADESETVESTSADRTPKQRPSTSTYGQDGSTDHTQQRIAPSNPEQRTKDLLHPACESPIGIMMVDCY